MGCGSSLAPYLISDSSALDKAQRIMDDEDAGIRYATVDEVLLTLEKRLGPRVRDQRLLLEHKLQEMQTVDALRRRITAHVTDLVGGLKFNRCTEQALMKRLEDRWGHAVHHHKGMVLDIFYHAREAYLLNKGVPIPGTEYLVGVDPSCWPGCCTLLN